MSNTRARKPGGGRKPSKPEYSAAKNLTQQMKAATDLYTDKMSLQAIADALALNPIKVRKLLITAGVYESDTAKLVQRTFDSFRSTQSYSAAVTSTMSALQWRGGESEVRYRGWHCSSAGRYDQGEL